MVKAAAFTAPPFFFGSTLSEAKPSKTSAALARI